MTGGDIILAKVGVVIPHFNSVNAVIKLLDSIYNDNKAFNLIETVVVDDKSTDDMHLLEEKIDDMENVKLIFNSSYKKGAGVCRNIGLKNIQSKWLIFADADDYFEENLINKILKFIDSKADIIYFRCISRMIGTSVIANRHHYLNSPLENYIKKPYSKNESLLKYNWLEPWGRMIRTSIVKGNKIRFDEIHVSNDVMFSMKLAAHTKNIETSPEILYCVTKSSGSLTTTKNKENYEIRSYVMIDRYLYLKNNIKAEEFKPLDIYFGKWLLDGIYLYDLSLKEGFQYFVLFKKNGIKFFPKLSKIFKLSRVVKETINEKNFKTNKG